jgi:hypothetical protein
MPVLREFAASMIGDTVMGIGILVVTIVVTIGLSVPINLLYILLADLTVVGTMQGKEAKKLGKLREFFKCLPSWWIMRYFNAYFYLYALVRVVVLKKGPAVFEKGH